MSTRNDLRELSRTRLKEARILHDAGLYAGAYHLAGLAVECALKAVIARTTRRHDFPDKRRVNESYSHILAALLRTSGLQSELGRAPSQVQVNWTTVKDWDINARYDASFNETKAKDLYKAVTVRRNGVMSWVRQYW